MYICTERDNKERSIVSLDSCKMKLNKKKSMATLEGPEKSSIYFAHMETMFLVKTEIEAVKFLKREFLPIDSVYLTIIGEPSKLDNVGDKEEISEYSGRGK